MRMQRVSISMYESDKWHGRPLHMELLKVCAQKGVTGATVVRGVAGYSPAMGISTSSLVDAGGVLPLVLDFVDLPERVEKVLQVVEEMARGRLITVSDAEVRSLAKAESHT